MFGERREYVVGGCVCEETLRRQDFKPLELCIFLENEAPGMLMYISSFEDKCVSRLPIRIL